MTLRLPAVDCILIATDFSEPAATAAGWAIGLARQHRGRVHFIHAVDSEPPADLSGSARPSVTDDVVSRLETLEREAAAAGVSASSEWGNGKPWKVIVEAQSRTGADLIVVGARGRTAYARILLGSTADRVIRMSPVPVLTVHPDDAARPAECRNVLVATDFSEEAAQATSNAIRLLRIPDHGGRLLLLHVCHLPLVYETEAVAAAIARQVAEDEDQARRQLETLAASLRTETLEVDTVVCQGYPAYAIVEEAKRADVDLIAVGTHGHSGLKHFFLGSVAERVVHHASCPVFTSRLPVDGEPVVLPTGIA
jgi:nucleotide-binding universal stress UspA family protein